MRATGTRDLSDCEDFESYAPAYLKIRTKTGKIEPFVFNRAQRYVHERLEAQKAETGRVRALNSKRAPAGLLHLCGRALLPPHHDSQGFRTFILTHEDAATKTCSRW